MTRLFIRSLLFVFVIAGQAVFSFAQPLKITPPESKPYKILTSGKQVTVKSSKDIKSIMVWTASGHRIVEQKEVNASSFTFTVNVSEKYFFVMIQYEGQKPFTEKIGI
jgi:hypothetical protein